VFGPTIKKQAKKGANCMKKIVSVIFYSFFCLAISVIFPRSSPSHLMVDESGCRECHELGDFSVEGLHGVHLACFSCHDGPVQLGTVNSSACLACHPRPLLNTEPCNLILFHEDNPGYIPSGPSCQSLGCHSDDCNNFSTTTTQPDTLCLSEKIYGEGSQEVTLLRALRDNLLSQTSEGQELIKLYYKWSPVIVEVIETDEVFKEELKNVIVELIPLLEITVE
jgi:hypothetical protein